MDSRPYFMIMRSFPLEQIRNLLFIMGQMLRIINKKQRIPFLTRHNLIISQSIKSNIMITNTHNNRYQSIEFLVDRLEHGINCIPTIVTTSITIIVGYVSTEDYYVRIEIYKVTCHLVTVLGHTQITTDCHFQLGGLLPRDSFVIGLFKS